MGLIDSLEQRDTAMTLEEVANVLVISTDTIYRLIKSGDLNPIPFGGRGGHRFDPADIAAWIRENKKGPRRETQPIASVKPLSRRRAPR